MGTSPDLTAAELWYEDAFETFPAVVAHEYWRLSELLAGGQVYGALLQTKDLFEVILKLPVLACAAWLYRKERDQAENKLIVDLLKEPLSLGTWESLGRRMLNQVELPQAAGAIEKHLSDVLALFSKHGLVKWRNDVIGHGALSLNEAHDLERDIAELLRVAKVFFVAQEGFYKSLELRLCGSGLESAVLRGVKLARFGDGPVADKVADKVAGRAAVSLRSGDFAVDLYPFVFLSGGDIFFFDSFLYRKEKSCVISYPPGFRRNEDLAEVAELARTVDLATAMASVKGGYAEATYLAENDAVIQSLFRVEDFRRPDHLVDWLSSALKAHPKGVFHLSMEMGMGKSTFARALDPTRCGSDMAIALKNTTVRGYYLNDSYLSSAEAFCNSVNDIFNRDKDGAPLFQSSTAAFPRLQPGSERPAVDLAELLRFYRDAYERHYGSARLLFVVDGLEEIPAGQARTILDFLPRTEELGDGVYILLTSRLAEELPSHFQGTAALRESTEAIVVSRRHEGYQAILRDYIRKNILEDLASAEALDIDTLVEKAESRFLYVRLYRDLLRSYGGERPVALPDGSELLERFLDRLRLLYGDKFHRNVTGLLAILASAYEPLTLRELASLSGREEVDFLMLAFLVDLRAFFKTERSYRGNLVSLHEEWKSAGKRLLAGNIRALVERWIGECAGLSADALDAGNEGMTYLLSRLAEYGKEYGIAGAWRTEAIAELLRMMIDKIKEKPRALHDVERELMMLDTGVELYGDLLKKGDAVEERLSDFSVRRGKVLSDLQKPGSAIADFDRAIAMRKKLEAEGRLLNGDAVADAYLNRGDAFCRLLELENAIADYGAAIEFREKLDEEGRLVDRNALLEAHMKLVNVFVYQGDQSKVIDTCSRILHISMQLDEEGFPSDHDLDARLYLRLGDSFMGLNDLEINNMETALSNYDKALAIRELQDAGDLLPNRNDLAYAYVRRARAVSTQGQREDALADYERAIEIREQLNAEGRLLDRDDLAEVYERRASVLLDSGKPEDAIIDFDRAVLVREKLDAEGRLLNRNILANTYINRGHTAVEMKRPEGALVDYSRALEIQEKLDAQGRFLDRSDLAYTYRKRGTARLMCGDFIGSIDDFLRANRSLKVGQEARYDSPEFRNRVSASIFGRDGWKRLSENELIGLQPKGPEAYREGVLGFSFIEARMVDLSFYPQTTLLELRVEAEGGPLWLLRYGGSVHVLDGTSAPIHAANAASPIKLSTENVIDYVRFFCFFVHGDEGPFFVVDSLEHPVFDRSRLDASQKALLEKELRAPEVESTSETGTHRVKASTVYGNLLSASTFEIKQDGDISMLDNKRVLGSLPINRLKGDYLFQGA